MALVPRLHYFAIERTAEPVSERLEAAAAASPSFRKACGRIAQHFANFEHNKSVRRIAHEQRMAMATSNDAAFGKPGSGAWQPADDYEPAPTLSEREATQRGCEILGEGFVLFVGLSLLLHQAANDRASEAMQEELMATSEQRITHLEESLATLDRRVKALEERDASTASAADGGAARSSVLDASSSRQPTILSRWWQRA